MANRIHPSCWKPRDVTHTVYKSLDLRKYNQLKNKPCILFDDAESRKQVETERNHKTRNSLVSILLGATTSHNALGVI